MNLNTIYNMDCLDGMRNLVPDESIDLVVTSPPYDGLRNYNNTLSDWNHAKFLEIANQISRVLKKGGVCVWVVTDGTENGSRTGTSFRQALGFMELGLNLNDTMIWRKTNPMPQVRQPRYAACFEYMFILSKGKPKTFNPILRETKCGGQNYNSTVKKPVGDGTRIHKSFKINRKAVEYNVWDMAVAQNKTGHPAVFPMELSDKHVISWSNQGDVVLDPFMGSGTTAMSCVKFNRCYVGFELNKDYVEMAEKRVSEFRNNLEEPPFTSESKFGIIDGVGSNGIIEPSNPPIQ